MALFNTNQITVLKVENKKLQNDIIELTKLYEAEKLGDSIFISKQKELIDRLKQCNQNLSSEIEELKNRSIIEYPIKTHNERGAGRKSRANSEIKELIQKLYADGYSYNKIADELSKCTGEIWSKSTIRYFLKST